MLVEVEEARLELREEDEDDETDVELALLDEEEAEERAELVEEAEEVGAELEDELLAVDEEATEVVELAPAAEPVTEDGSLPIPSAGPLRICRFLIIRFKLS